MCFRWAAYDTRLEACAQALLWFGIKRSKRAPTKMHPYGYMRDKFVFSLISAVGIFCLGAGVSVWNGVSGLLAATPVEHVGWSIAGTRRLVRCGWCFKCAHVSVEGSGAAERSLAMYNLYGI